MESKKKVNGWKYIENVRNTLKNLNIRNESTYTHLKYLRATGCQEGMGVLAALDELLKHKGVKIKGRKDIDDYRNFVAKENYKILGYLNSAYNLLHLLMGYDGELKVTISKEGIELAEKIIEWVEKQLPKNYFYEK